VSVCEYVRAFTVVFFLLGKLPTLALCTTDSKGDMHACVCITFIFFLFKQTHAIALYITRTVTHDTSTQRYHNHRPLSVPQASPFPSLKR
jgi:hypothetical protein